MNCKETEKMIPAYLQNELEGKALDLFMEHIESCPECKEELSIQFLVSEGMEQLEAGNNFNLQKALQAKLAGALREVKVWRILWHVLLCLEVGVAAYIVIALVIVFCL